MSVLPALVLKNGHPIATSLAVAADFGKQHKDVLRAIQRLECSEEFNRRNFALVEYLDQKGESRPMYEMTRDGFTFLAMGFTGKTAAEWKEKYIAAFNAMESAVVGAAHGREASRARPAPTAIALEPARYIELLEAENALLRGAAPETGHYQGTAKFGKARFWTQGEIQSLKALRHKGLGAMRISRELPGRSKEAVAHMLRRLDAEDAQ